MADDPTVTSQSKLTPGQHLQYGLPFSTEYRTLTVSGIKVLVLHVEHATGSTDLPMPADVAERIFGQGVKIARQLQGKPTGDLEIASVAQLRAVTDADKLQ